MAPAAAEFDLGAGVLELGSEKSALMKGFRPFSAEKRSTKLGKHRLHSGEERGRGADAAEVDPGAGALGSGSEKGALTKDFRPLSADYKTKRTLNGMSRHFHPLVVPNKADDGKPSMIWTR